MKKLYKKSLLLIYFFNLINSNEKEPLEDVKFKNEKAYATNSVGNLPTNNFNTFPPTNPLILPTGPQTGGSGSSSGQPTSIIVDNLILDLNNIIAQSMELQENLTVDGAINFTNVPFSNINLSNSNGVVFLNSQGALNQVSKSDLSTWVGGGSGGGCGPCTSFVVNGPLSADGDINLNNGSTTGTSGVTNIGTTSNAGNINIGSNNKAIHIYGNTTIDNLISLNQTFRAATVKGDFSVEGNSVVSNDQSVEGNVIFNGNAEFKSNILCSSNATYNERAFFNNGFNSKLTSGLNISYNILGEETGLLVPKNILSATSSVNNSDYILTLGDTSPTVQTNINGITNINSTQLVYATALTNIATDPDPSNTANNVKIGNNCDVSISGKNLILSGDNINLQGNTTPNITNINIPIGLTDINVATSPSVLYLDNGILKTSDQSDMQTWIGTGSGSSCGTCPTFDVTGQLTTGSILNSGQIDTVGIVSTGGTTLTAGLDVYGAVNINTDTNNSSVTNIGTALSAGDITIGNGINNNVYISNLITTGLDLSDATNIGTSVGAGNIVIGNGTNSVTINGTFSFPGLDASAASNFGITSLSNINIGNSTRNLTINGNSIEVNGNTLLNGNLATTGTLIASNFQPVNIDASGTITSQGVITAVNGISATGPGVFYNGMAVSGVLNSQDTAIGGFLNASAGTNIDGEININAEASGGTPGITNIGTSSSAGRINIGNPANNTNILGTTTINTLNVNNLTATNQSFNTANVTNLTVTGTLTANTLQFLDTAVSGDFSVSGISNLNGGINLLGTSNLGDGTNPINLKGLVNIQGTDENNYLSLKGNNISLGNSSKISYGETKNSIILSPGNNLVLSGGISSDSIHLVGRTYINCTDYAPTLIGVTPIAGPITIGGGGFSPIRLNSSSIVLLGARNGIFMGPDSDTSFVAIGHPDCRVYSPGFFQQINIDGPCNINSGDRIYSASETNLGCASTAGIVTIGREGQDININGTLNINGPLVNNAAIISPQTSSQDNAGIFDGITKTLKFYNLSQMREWLGISSGDGAFDSLSSTGNTSFSGLVNITGSQNLNLKSDLGSTGNINIGSASTITQFNGINNFSSGLSVSGTNEISLQSSGNINIGTTDGNITIGNGINPVILNNAQITGLDLSTVSNYGTSENTILIGSSSSTTNLNNLTVNGVLNAPNFDLTGATNIGTSIGAGNIVIGNGTNSVTINGTFSYPGLDASASSNLGTSSINDVILGTTGKGLTINSNSLNISSNANFLSGATIASGGLDVTDGITVSSGGITVSSGGITLSDGGINIIGGSTTITRLDIINSLTVNAGGAIINDGVSVMGGLRVSGGIVLDDGSLLINGDLEVDGDTAFYGNINFNDNSSIDSNGNLSLGAGIDVFGTAVIRENASFYKNIIGSQNLTLNGLATLGGGLSTSGKVLISANDNDINDINIGTKVRIDSISIGNLTSSTYLNGTVVMTNPITMQNINLDNITAGIINVGSLTGINTLSSSNNNFKVLSNGDLQVNGIANLGTLNVTNNSVFAGNSLTLSGLPIKSTPNLTTDYVLCLNNLAKDAYIVPVTAFSSSSSSSSSIDNLVVNTSSNLNGTTNIQNANIQNLSVTNFTGGTYNPTAIACSGAITSGGLLTGNSGLTIIGTTNINSTGTAATNIGTGGGLVTIGKAGVTTTVGGNLSVTGTIGISGLLTANNGLTLTGATNINTTGAGTTNIGTGGTGVVNIGNTTGGIIFNGPIIGNITQSGTLTVSSLISSSLKANGATNINTTGSGTTNIGTGGTGAVNIGNTTGNTFITGQLGVTGVLTSGLVATSNLYCNTSNSTLNINLSNGNSNTTISAGSTVGYVIIGSGNDSSNNVKIRSGSSGGVQINTDSLGSTTIGNTTNNNLYIQTLSVIQTGTNPLYTTTNGQVTSSSSTKRHKKNIEKLEITDEQFLNLEPVKFRYKDGHFDNGEAVYLGFLAEDIEKIEEINNAVIYDAEGLPVNINYNSIFTAGLQKTIDLVKRFNNFKKDFEGVSADQLKDLLKEIASEIKNKNLISDFNDLCVKESIDYSKTILFLTKLIVEIYKIEKENKENFEETKKDFLKRLEYLESLNKK